MEKKLITSTSKGHVLTYNDASHRYKLDEKHIGSVTGILRNGYPESHFLTGWKVGQGAEFAINTYKDLFKEKEKLKKRVTKKEIEEIIKKSKTAYMKKSQEAASIGTMVHDYVYSSENHKPFDVGLIQQHPDREKIEKAISQYHGWKESNRDSILSAEGIVASPTYWFAGRFDRLALRGNKVVLSDFKTSSGIYVDMFIQLASYKIAIEEWMGNKIDAFEILRFGKEGVFETQYVDDQKDIKSFTEQAIRVIGTSKFRKEYED